MPDVTDDDSKAVQRIAEIERQLQEAKGELDRWLAAGDTPSSAAELAQRERAGKTLTDRLQALATALATQRALASHALHEQERKLAKASPKKMKDFGDRPVTVQFLGGVEVERMARYGCRSQARAERAKGSDFGLTLLGVCDRTTPALDGSRLRVRKNKLGKKTKKGRSRYRTDWREPKLLVIDVVDERGRPAPEFAPVMDGTLQGPDAVFRLLAFDLRELGIDQAKEVLFMADGAKWIWERVTTRWQRLGLVGVVRCRELVDFYHVVAHIDALAALNTSWRAGERKRWATRQRRRWWRGELEAFIQQVERFCRRKRGKGWSRERDYLLRNARAGRLDYAKARGAKMPMGSGSIKSAVRQVINLQLKGPGIFWHEEHAEPMLRLRAYDKSKHWQVLTNKAFATPLTNPA
mgnify:CR=1 FL=1